jgi:Mg2+ and Co2+ transporter CorA
VKLIGLFDEYWQLRELLASQARIIDDLEKQIAHRSPEGALVDTLRQFQDEILAEVPFPDGKIPDNVWLTPGEPDRAER